MKEFEVIKILVILMGVLGLVLVCFDRWNDALREENKKLREELKRFRSKGGNACGSASGRPSAQDAGADRREATEGKQVPE